VGRGIGDNLGVEEEVLEEKERENEKNECEGEEEQNKREFVNKREEKEEKNKSEEKKREKGEKQVPQLKSLPYPQNPSKKDKERQFARFMDIFKRLQINIPFVEAMEQMPTYAKFMKELLTKKRRFSEETVELEAGCSAIIQKSLPQKSKDPGSFTIPVTIGTLPVGKALLDLGASINLMPLSMLKRIGDLEVRPTRMTLQLADRSMKYPYGVAEDVLVKVDKFMFPVDFVVMDIEEDTEVPLILGRPFMKTAKVIIDVDDGKLKVRVQDDEVNFNVFEAMQHPKDKQQCFRMDVIDEFFLSSRKQLAKASPLEKALIGACDDLEEDEEKEVDEYLTHLNSAKEIESNDIQLEKLQQENRTESQKLELKVLPPHLKYVFLADGGNKPVVISSTLTASEEEKLISVLKANEGAIGWTLSDLKGISPSYCMHKIHMEQDYKPGAQPQN